MIPLQGTLDLPGLKGYPDSSRESTEKTSLFSSVNFPPLGGKGGLKKRN